MAGKHAAPRRGLIAALAVATVLTLGTGSAALALTRLAGQGPNRATAATTVPRGATPPASTPGTADRAGVTLVTPTPDPSGSPLAGSPRSGSTVAGSAPSGSTQSASASSGDGTQGASSSPSGPYRVVGLGDSVPAGSACDCTSYVTLVGKQQADQAGRTASVSNLAEGGLTTSGLLAQLQDSAVRSTIAEADLVIVTIGANDFDAGIVTDSSCQAPALACYQSTLQQQAGQLSTVLSEVDALQSGHGGEVVVTGYWNVFLDGQVGAAEGSSYVQNSNALTLADNAVIATASRNNSALYVDIYTPFKGDGSDDDTALLASDGDHPNALGHQRIAQALEKALTAG